MWFFTRPVAVAGVSRSGRDGPPICIADCGLALDTPPFAQRTTAGTCPRGESRVKLSISPFRDPRCLFPGPPPASEHSTAATRGGRYRSHAGFTALFSLVAIFHLDFTPVHLLWGLSGVYLSCWAQPVGTRTACVPAPPLMSPHERFVPSTYARMLLPRGGSPRLRRFRRASVAPCPL